MRLLAWESVTRSGSACVAEDGRELAYADLAGAPAEARLLPELDSLWRRHGPLDALAVAAGPGSFTGLRVGVLAARTLAWLERLPVHPVDSLAACAAERGDGLWLVLLPLKRDTTFHGLFRVSGGRVETLSPTTACLDAERPSLPGLSGAVAVGPALAQKPDLAVRWCPGLPCGDPAGPTARGVARLAAQVPAVAWEHVLPAYHQEPAPVLQREAARRTSAAPSHGLAQPR
jgi:tRNA threonylcarbamoyl adenosine modification protein YeaZ